MGKPLSVSDYILCAVESSVDVNSFHVAQSISAAASGWSIADGCIGLLLMQNNYWPDVNMSQFKVLLVSLLPKAMTLAAGEEW